jgi:hypothetical protein
VIASAPARAEPTPVVAAAPSRQPAAPQVQIGRVDVYVAAPGPPRDPVVAPVIAPVAATPARERLSRFAPVFGLAQG